MSLTDDLYKDIILQHSQNPSHRDPVPDATITEEGVNRSCGDEITVQLKMEDGIIKKIGLSGKGCSISTASSSLMGDAVTGLSKDQALSLIASFKNMLTSGEDPDLPEEFEELEALSGVKKYPIRVKCATLAWNTLEQALREV
jgi:nitrogen fixation protein NifU and related proteins